MKNHESRPTGATPFPEANVVFLNNINGRGRGRGRNRGRGRDRGRGRSNYTLRGNNHLDFKKTTNDDHRGTKFTISNALFSSKSKRNLLSFKDIRQNGYQVETNYKNNIEYLYIAFIVSHEKRVLETPSAFSSGLYYTDIRVIETYATINPKFMNLNMFTI